MDRRNKKFLLCSALFHGFLLLLLIFGAAFFVANDKPLELPRINVVPSKMVEDALAGGGGNPNIARTEDRQKGDTLVPQQPVPTPPPAEKVKPTPTPPPPDPVKPSPEPKETPKPPTPKAAIPKVTEVKKPESKPKETVRPTNDILSQLTVVKRSAVDKEKARKEAEQREAARQAAEQARQARVAQESFASAIGKATSTLRAGFASGTKVKVGGSGGEAYANYAAVVQEVYENEWHRNLPKDFAEGDPIAVVKVTIAKTGAVLDSHISSRSGSSVMDKSVQRALDHVKALPPFPEAARDPERTFTIEFNLKAKRLAG